MLYLAKSHYIYIWKIWLQTVLERNPISAKICQLTARTQVLGGHGHDNFEMYLEAVIV
jgi:hypothetical protein